jgi:hypothetical protein
MNQVRSKDLPKKMVEDLSYSLEMDIRTRQQQKITTREVDK